MREQCKVIPSDSLQTTGDSPKAFVEACRQSPRCQGAAASIQRGWRGWAARVEAERRRLAFLIVHSNADVCWPLPWLRSIQQQDPIGEEGLGKLILPSPSAQHQKAAACIQRGWRVQSARAEIERRRLAYLIATSNCDPCWPLAWLRLDRKELCERQAARAIDIVMLQRFLRARNSGQVAACRASQRQATAAKTGPGAARRRGTVGDYEGEYLHHREVWGRKEIEKQAVSARQDLDALFQQSLALLSQKAAPRKTDVQRRLVRPRPMSTIGERQVRTPSPVNSQPHSPTSPGHPCAAQQTSPKVTASAALSAATLSPTAWPHSELLLHAEAGARLPWAHSVTTHVYKKSSTKASHLPPLERALCTSTTSRPCNAIFQHPRTISIDESLDALLLDLPSPTAQRAAAPSLPPAAVLDRSGEGLRDSQVQPLLQSLCGVRSIQKLALSHNKLTDASLRELLPVLSHPGCALRILELAGNHFTKATLRPFFDILGGVNRTVEVLDLSGCLRDPNSHRLLQALQGNGHLQTLVLDGNQIGEEGVAAIAAVVRHPCCALTTLSLAQNAINNRGIRHLLTATRGNPLLTHLTCQGNPCSDVYLQEMGFLTEMNCGISKPSRAQSPHHVPRGVSPPWREQTESIPCGKRNSIGKASGFGMSPRREQTDPLPASSSPTARKRSLGRPPALLAGQQTFAGNFVRNRHKLSPTVCVQ